jgi:hypothetical protein
MHQSAVITACGYYRKISCMLQSSSFFSAVFVVPALCSESSPWAGDKKQEGIVDFLASKTC